MPRQSNARRSQWEVIDRRLTLLLRLMRGPASTDELLAIIEDKARAVGDRLNRDQVERLFEEDRHRLRTLFMCEIAYSRSEDLYTLVSVDYPLLDVSPEALRGLAFLQSTFGVDAAPMSVEVQSLLSIVAQVLPRQRKNDLMRERGLLEVNLQPRDENTIGDAVWEAVERACSQHQYLEFDYRSSQQSDGIPRRHLVEPWRHYFDTVRSHYYLETYWIESRGPLGVHRQEKVQKFRLGQMENIQVLPKHFVPGRRVPTYELAYELMPAVARLGVTKHIPDCVVNPRPDGGAVVRAASKDLFFDLRTLLHYGPNCRVIGGAEALRQMKALIKAMYERYEGTDQPL